MTLAALPRSALHLQFLVANGAEPDVVFYRDDFMREGVEAAYPGRGAHLGRETLPPKNLAGLLRARRANRAYYASLPRKISELGVDRLIIFLEGEPLERYLCALTCVREIELWEDGLSHYVDLTSDLWYGARGVVQAACGFWPREITRRRMDRSRVLVRDRFEHRNLRLPVPGAGERLRDEVLLIGSPLVEDRIVTRAAFLAGARAITARNAMPVRYLAHPRENLGRLREDVQAVGMALEENAQGLFAHVEAYAYRAYLSAVSTGLLDIGRFSHSAFVPGIFGLARMERVLAGWAHNPVPVLPDGERLAAFIGSLPPGLRVRLPG